MTKPDPPAAWLQAISPPLEGEKFPLTGEEFVIGRSAGCDLVLKEDTVSSRHARLFKKDRQWMAADLQSTNGTRLNGQAIVQSPIHTGDRISVESMDLQFINSGEIQLRSSSGDRPEKSFSFSGPDLVIGRSPTCQVILTEETVSAQHARIFQRDNGWWIRDLDSTNGTRLNGRAVTEHPLRSGDTIGIESREFTFINPLEVARTAVPREEVPATRLREPEIPAPERRTPASGSPLPAAHPSPAGWSRGLTLGLLFALLVNIGYPFLIALMKLPQVTGRNLLMVLSNILSRLPLLHLPTHWIKFFNRDALSISLMVVLVLGLLGGGVITRRTGPKNPLAAALFFSLLYLIITQAAQLLVLKLNFTRFVNQYTQVGVTFNDNLTAFLAGTGLSLATAFVLALLGGLPVRHRRGKSPTGTAGES